MDTMQGITLRFKVHTQFTIKQDVKMTDGTEFLDAVDAEGSRKNVAIGTNVQ